MISVKAIAWSHGLGLAGQPMRHCQLKPQRSTAFAKPRAINAQHAESSVDSRSSKYSSGRVAPPEHAISDLAEGELTGPLELPPQDSDPFGTSEYGPIQVAASLLLTGAITVLLVRSLRRRSQRSKEMKFRSNAVERLNTPSNGLKLPPPVEPLRPPAPSAISALGGALVAGAIAFALWRVTTGLEDTLNSQPLSNNYTIRNITITIRTILTGSCWLGTFVFGANSLGLGLLSVQTAFGLGPESTAPGRPEPQGEKEKEEVSQKE